MLFRQVLALNPYHDLATLQLTKALDQGGKPEEALSDRALTKLTITATMLTTRLKRAMVSVSSLISIRRLFAIKSPPRQIDRLLNGLLGGYKSVAGSEAQSRSPLPNRNSEASSESPAVFFCG